jgi:hypothetical protein
MKIELGKRYKRRDGVITGHIECNINNPYPFTDPMVGYDYTLDGVTDSNTKDNADLVEEYVEPKKAEIWGAVDTSGNVLMTSIDRKWLGIYWGENRIIKLREVTDE